MNIRRFPMQFDRVSLKGTQELKRNDTEEKVEIEPETATKQQVPARKALTASVNDIITLYNEANVQIRPVVISDGTTNKPVDNGDSGYGTPVDTIDNSDSDYGVPNTNGKKATFVKLDNTIEPTPDPDVDNNDSGYGVPSTDSKPTGSIDELRKHRIK